MIRLKLAIGVLSAASLTFPALVHAQCTRCCGIQGFGTSLTVTPTTAEEGQPVSITIGVYSCYYVAKVFTATVNLTPTASGCAAFAEAFSASGIVYPGQHRIFTYTLPAPKCDSTYNVTMNGTVRAILTVD
jgi:hypothetical protein